MKKDVESQGNRPDKKWPPRKDKKSYGEDDNNPHEEIVSIESFSAKARRKVHGERHTMHLACMGRFRA